MGLFVGFPDLHRGTLGIYLSQKQYFSTRVNFLYPLPPPQGRFDHVWRYFGSSRLGGMPIASSRWRPETPTILQRTGQAPTTKMYQVQNVSSVENEKSCLKEAKPKQARVKGNFLTTKELTRTDEHGHHRTTGER